MVTLLIGNGAPGQSLTSELISSGLDAVTFEIGLAGLAVGDVRGNGKIDIVTIGDHGSPHFNATEAGIMVWTNNGDGTNWALVKEGEAKSRHAPLSSLSRVAISSARLV